MSERYAQFLCLFFGSHPESVPCRVLRRNTEFNHATYDAWHASAVPYPR